MLKRILKMFGFGLSEPVAPYVSVRKYHAKSVTINKPIGGSVREVTRHRRRQLERGIIHETHPVLTDHRRAARLAGS